MIIFKNIIMKKKILIILLLYITGISLDAQETPESINLDKINSTVSERVITPLARVTEKERFAIKNPEVGILLYQTDNLSGLYSYTAEGWIAISVGNKDLLSASICPKVTTVDTVSDLTGLFESCGQDVTTAIVLGYHEKNDGGGGVFAYNASRDGETDDGLVFDGWERTLVHRSLNVKWFGAKANVPGAYTADLVANNNAAFQKTLLALQETGLQSGPSGNLFSNTAILGIFIPSGEYALGANGLFNGIDNGSVDDPLLFDVVTRSITYFSDGNAILAFTNTGENEYAFKNDNVGQEITFRDITFVGVSPATNFVFSDAQANAQDYFFDRCTFRGSFNRVFTIRGGPNGNLNSEWGFRKCAFFNSASVILDISDSDQFLNYWFDQTKFWMTGNSRVLRADNGGHFKFVNCDWSRFAPTEETYLFELTDDLSNFGVNDFRIINGRFEMQTEHARVLKSNWNMGNIEISADFGQAINRPFFRNNVNGVKHFEFNLKRNTSVNISFDNSVMMGYHEYNYTSNSFEGTARASYNNCSFPVRNKLDGFIRIDENGHFNRSGISFVEIENAIFNDLRAVAGQDLNLEIPSVHYLPIFSNRGLKQKYFKIGHPARGGNPIGGERFVLNFPEEAGSVITKVTWLLPEGRLTSFNNATFILEDLNGNDIATVNGRLRDGYNEEDRVFVNVRNLPEGKLVLRAANANQTAPEFFCLIEYF